MIINSFPFNNLQKFRLKLTILGLENLLPEKKVFFPIPCVIPQHVPNAGLLTLSLGSGEFLSGSAGWFSV